MVCSVGRTSGREPFSKEYCSRSTAHTRPSRVPEGTVRSHRMNPGSTAGMSRPSRRYSAIAAWIPGISSAALFRFTSGRISRRAEGASPTVSYAFFQYSGSEVYWSQAMQAQVSRGTEGAGSRMRAGRMPTRSKAMAGSSLVSQNLKIMPTTAEMAMKITGCHFSFRWAMKSTAPSASAFQMNSCPRSFVA